MFPYSRRVLALDRVTLFISLPSFYSLLTGQVSYLIGELGEDGTIWCLVLSF